MNEGCAPITIGVSPAEYGVAEYGAAEYGAAEYGAAEYGAAEYGAAEYGAAEYGYTYDVPPLLLFERDIDIDLARTCAVPVYGV